MTSLRQLAKIAALLLLTSIHDVILGIMTHGSPERITPYTEEDEEVRTALEVAAAELKGEHSLERLASKVARQPANNGAFEWQDVLHAAQHPVFIGTVILGVGTALLAGTLTSAAHMKDDERPARVQAMSQALRDPEALSTLGLCAAELQEEARLIKSIRGVREQIGGLGVNDYLLAAEIAVANNVSCDPADPAVTYTVRNHSNAIFMFDAADFVTRQLPLAE